MQVIHDLHIFWGVVRYNILCSGAERINGIRRFLLSMYTKQEILVFSENLIDYLPVCGIIILYNYVPMEIRSMK